MALENSRIMIHQPLGGTQGQASDIQIVAREIDKLKKELYQIIARHSNKSYEEVCRDGDRDFWMTSQEALAYGMIDEVLQPNRKKFYKAIQSYTLPEKRLEIIYDNKIKIFKDFAHSPSKLKSTVNAVKNQYSKNLLVVYELHSSSSFSTEFLTTYRDTLKNSDTSIIYF